MLKSIYSESSFISISTLQNFSYADFVFVVFDEMKMDDKSVLIFVVEQLFCGLVVTLIDNSPFDIFKRLLLTAVFLSCLDIQYLESQIFIKINLRIKQI